MLPPPSTLPAAFKNAWSGIRLFFRLGRNAKIQGAIAMLAVAAAVWLKMSRVELAVILLCCAVVIGLEMMNSALEKICDFIKPDLDPRIGFVKDVAAGAVLWAAVISTLVGALLFLPYLLALSRK